jgi:hypothetical protein
MRWLTLATLLTLLAGGPIWAQSSRVDEVQHDHTAGSIDATELGTDSVAADEIASGAVGFPELTSSAIQPEEHGVAMGFITFCGLGPNATAESYFSPISPYVDTTVDWSIGGATPGCDTNSGTVIGTQDASPLGIGAFNLHAKWLHCSFVDGTAGSENDTITYTLYDDTAATALACNITLDGTGETKACDDSENNGFTIAADSALTVGLVAVNDNLSAAGNDGFCIFSFLITNDN